MVALAKIVAGVLGGSAIMLAEAGHSMADTLNQVLMYVSLRLSGKEPDASTPSVTGRNASSGR